ncbi:MAG: CoA-binding protein [Pseudomonadota bacterium]
MSQETLQAFEPIFYPRSIAVVGASEDGLKFGTRYLQALISSGFKGGLYPINPHEDKVLGLKTYPKLASIPDSVDYVIVSIPARLLLELLDECAAKGVKAVQIFTAGFSETGEEEGVRLEKQIAKKAREGGFRIIGPNCIGVYSPAGQMPYGPMYFGAEAGSVGFVSHSGGVGGTLIDEGVRRGIRFSKVVSFGNGCDLDTCDYLEYLAIDPDTKIVGAYLEGAKESRRLLGMVREISKTKPMIIWKGGRTSAGAETAASHSASLAGSEVIWKAALKQAGAIKVESHEELVDTILAFQHLSWFEGSRIAVIAGLYGAGGGISVASSDACTKEGLEVPPFSDETRTQLKTIIPKAGSIMRNPLDMGAAGGIMAILSKTIELVLDDPLIEALIIQVPVDLLFGFGPGNVFHDTIGVIVNFRKTQTKPIIVLSPHGEAVAERLEFESRLSDAKIPVYPTVERAARAIVNISWYCRFHGSKNP